MSKSIFFCLLASITVFTACQSTPNQYNGTSGYQIESQTSGVTTLSYTLSGQTSLEKNQAKLQRACQQVLGKNNTYKINILSQTEIANPAKEQIQQSVQIGQSRTSFGLSNMPSTNNDENYAALQGLETSPKTLTVIRYTCS
ncbi:hypothetical protein GWI33_002946 [Rhynchophorus ferrugineus]|uniref:Lipoprotein n=1 Tax=Rhynchophorus ferrugineus TaxID=354439 RepID=A0A834IFE8_RHYFE|nr:hypothetical protein GWI33_002946 [Rhynchophorus ferrugineus]